MGHPERVVIPLASVLTQTLKPVLNLIALPTIQLPQAQSQRLFFTPLRWAEAALLRFYPGIGAGELDRHIRYEDVQGLAIGGAAVLG